MLEDGELRAPSEPPPRLCGPQGACPSETLKLSALLGELRLLSEPHLPYLSMGSCSVPHSYGYRNIYWVLSINIVYKCDSFIPGQKWDHQDFSAWFFSWRSHQNPGPLGREPAASWRGDRNAISRSRCSRGRQRVEQIPQEY